MKAFTLIELLAVLAIVAALATGIGVLLRGIPEHRSLVSGANSIASAMLVASESARSRQCAVRLVFPLEKTPAEAESLVLAVQGDGGWEPWTGSIPLHRIRLNRPGEGGEAGSVLAGPGAIAGILGGAAAHWIEFGPDGSSVPAQPAVLIRGAESGRSTRRIILGANGLSRIE